MEGIDSLADIQTNTYKVISGEIEVRTKVIQWQGKSSVFTRRVLKGLPKKLKLTLRRLIEVYKVNTARTFGHSR